MCRDETTYLYLLRVCDPCIYPIRVPPLQKPLLCPEPILNEFVMPAHTQKTNWENLSQVHFYRSLHHQHQHCRPLRMSQFRDELPSSKSHTHQSRVPWQTLTIKRWFRIIERKNCRAASRTPKNPRTGEQQIHTKSEWRYRNNSPDPISMKC